MAVWSPLEKMYRMAKTDGRGLTWKATTMRPARTARLRKVQIRNRFIASIAPDVSDSAIADGAI